MLAWKPAAANLSHISFAVSKLEGEKKKNGLVLITRQFSINLYSTWLIIFLRIPLCHGL